MGVYILAFAGLCIFLPLQGMPCLSPTENSHCSVYPTTSKTEVVELDGNHLTFVQVRNTDPTRH